MQKTELKKIISAFNIDIESEIIPLNRGLINDTFKIKDSKNHSFILQKINTEIFKSPDKLMNNISSVTSHIKEKIKEKGGETDRETLTIIPTVNNSLYYKSEDNSCWRCYLFIDNSYSVNKTEDENIIYSFGKAVGKFSGLLRDFDSLKLYEVIPDFHNTKSRLNSLLQSFNENKSGRAINVLKEKEFALRYFDEANMIYDLLSNGEIPFRVCHNDTKINNVLFDNDTNNSLCLIDLDTVMPGSGLFDFGDAVRSSCCTTDENDSNFGNTGIDLKLFKKFADGYLEEAGNYLNEKEISLLPFSVKLITLECGIRFLKDYIDGDIYFKTNYDEHNLVRCRNQFALVRDIELNINEMNNIIKEIRG